LSEARSLFLLIEDKKIPGMIGVLILVAISPRHTPVRRFREPPARGKARPAETIPHLEKKYRVDAKPGFYCAES
ncbi:MAG TPA: hypothetical protein VK579_09385, partial [Terriglobales bacterium]|nr:hypothetical protein [Terriglobales bacterium]